MNKDQSASPRRAPLTVWGRILLVLFFFIGLGAVAGSIGVMKDVMPESTSQDAGARWLYHGHIVRFEWQSLHERLSMSETAGAGERGIVG